MIGRGESTADEEAVRSVDHRRLEGLALRDRVHHDVRSGTIQRGAETLHALVVVLFENQQSVDAGPWAGPVASGCGILHESGEEGDDRVLVPPPADEMDGTGLSGHGRSS